MKHLKSMAAAALALAALLSLPALPSFASDAGGKDPSAADSAGLTCGSCGAGVPAGRCARPYGIA